MDKPSLETGVMETTIVEELASRLPTAELVKIIKRALECGRRNVPFTETDLLRAMTFGTSSTYVRAPQASPQSSHQSSLGARAPRR